MVGKKVRVENRTSGGTKIMEGVCTQDYGKTIAVKFVGCTLYFDKIDVLEVAYNGRWYKNMERGCCR